MQEQSWNASA